MAQPQPLEAPTPPAKELLRGALADEAVEMLSTGGIDPPKPGTAMPREFVATPQIARPFLGVSDEHGTWLQIITPDGHKYERQGQTNDWAETDSKGAFVQNVSNRDMSIDRNGNLLVDDKAAGYTTVIHSDGSLDLNKGATTWHTKLDARGVPVITDAEVYRGNGQIDRIKMLDTEPTEITFASGYKATRSLDGSEWKFFDASGHDAGTIKGTLLMDPEGGGVRMGFVTGSDEMNRALFAQASANPRGAGQLLNALEEADRRPLEGAPTAAGVTNSARDMIGNDQAADLAREQQLACALEAIRAQHPNESESVHKLRMLIAETKNPVEQARLTHNFDKMAATLERAEQDPVFKADLRRYADMSDEAKAAEHSRSRYGGIVFLTQPLLRVMVSVLN